MATVHRAEVTSGEGFRRPVALKFIHEGLADRPELEAQFRSEARLISHLQHTNIVQVLDFDRDPRGRLFIAMELVDGTDLRKVRDFGPMPVGLVVHVAAEVLSGLDYAHGAADRDGQPLGIVHRDLSPQNILVSWDGAVKITDFGIAQGLAGATTQTGIIKGNAGYLSPEQVEGMPLDARSDVYGVGVLMHELLLGAPLFAVPGREVRAVLSQILLGRISWPSDVRPEVPEALSAFVLRMCAQDRDDRPASAAAALEELLELGLLDAGARRGLAQYLPPIRRTLERPTVLDEDAPEDLSMPEPVSGLARRARPPMTFAFDTRPVLAETVPSQTSLQTPGDEPSVPPPSPRRGWLPWLTAGLAILAVGLGVGVLGTSGGESSGRAEPRATGGALVPLPSGAEARKSEPVESPEPEVVEAAPASPDAGVEAPAAEPAPRPRTRTARRRARRRPERARANPTPKREPADAAAPAPPPDAGLRAARAEPTASARPARPDAGARPDLGVVLLPYEAGDDILPFPED